MSDTSVSFIYPWREDLIGNIGSVTVGGTPRTSVDKYWDGDVPWMVSGDVHLKKISDVPSRITELGLKYSNATMVDPPAVAIGLAGQGKTRGTVALVLCRLCTNQSVALIKGDPETIDTTYLLYNLEFRYEELRSRSAGGGRAGLSKQLIEQVPVPLPVTPEQTKIAEILSTVDGAIEQTEALITKQQRIKTGLMRDFLTRGIDEHGNLRSEQTHLFKDSPLGRIPVEWEVETLGRVIGPIVSGWSPTCEAVPASEGEWAILKTTAVVWAGYTPSENKRLPSGLRGVPSIEVHADDILVTRKGPVERVGVVVYVKETRSRLMIPDTVFRMRVLDGSKVLPAFLPHALGSAPVQSEWFQKKIGLADAQVNLNHSILRATIFPRPEPKEQQLLVASADKLLQQTHGDLSRLSKLRSLKTALMQDLLIGKKRVTPLLEAEAAK